MERGTSGQSRKPLLSTTIQESGLLGNRISLRNTGLFSGFGKRGRLSCSSSVFIFAADHYTGQAVSSPRFSSLARRNADSG